MPGQWLLTPEELAAAREAGLAARAQREAAKPAKAAPAPEKPTDVAGAARAFGEGALSGAIDVAMSPVTLAASGVEALAGEGSDVGQFAAKAREAAGGRAMLGSLVGMTSGEDARAEYEASARAAAKDHGLAAGAGELVGGIAGLVGTAGLGGLAGGAKAGAQRLVGTGLAGRLAGATAQGAVEGAAFGAASAQNEAWIAQRRLTGQQVLATAGLSGLLGGALSFSAEGMGALIGAGRNAITERLGTKPGIGRAKDVSGVGAEAESGAGRTFYVDREGVASETLGGTARDSVTEKSLGQQVADRVKPIIETATRSDDAAVRQAGKAALGEDMGERMPEFYRDIVRGRDVRPRIVSEASGRLTEDASTVMRSSSELADEMVSRASKLEHVEANFARTPPPATAMGQARGAAESLLRETQEIESAVAAVSKSAGGEGSKLAHLSGEMSLGLKAVSEAKSPAQAYMAIDHMRRQLHRSMDSMAKAAKSNADPLLIRTYEDAAEALRGTYQKAADHLFDSSVWGAQGAAQREVNDAWVQFIEAKKFAFGDIARQRGEKLLPSGAKMPVFEIQEGRVAGIVDRFGTPGGRDSLRSFEQYVSAAERLSNAIGKGYQLGGTKSKALAELQKSVASIRGTLDSVAKDTASLSQAEALFKGGEHSLIGGVLGRAADIAGVSGPAASMRARVTLEVNANRAAKQIQQAIDYVFQPPAKAAAKEAAREVPGFVQRAAGATSAAARRVPARMSASSAMAHFIGRHGTAEVAYERRKDEILAANANNGEAIRNAVADSLGALGRQDPHAMASMVVSATKGAQYLQSKLPQAPNTPSFTPMTNARRPPSRAEIAQFAELYEAVDRPLQTLSKLGLGIVSRDQVRAIADVYPELYEHIKTEVLARIRKQDELGKEIPYRQRVVLDTVLDLAGQADRTLQPDFALKYGPAIRATAPQPSDAAPKPPTKSTIPNRYSTGTTTMLGGQS